MSEMLARGATVLRGYNFCDNCNNMHLKCATCKGMFKLFEKIICYEEADARLPQEHYHVNCFAKRLEVMK